MTSKQNRILFLLIFLTIVFTIAGSTLAYWNWQTSEDQKTEVTFTVTKDFECAADGGGSITSGEAFIAPTSCTNSTHAIQRKLTVMPTLYSDNLTINMQLYLDVNSLDTGLSNSQNFRYALTTSSTSCESGVISSGNFNGLTTGKKVEILNRNYNSSESKTYYLYIWLDKAETSPSTMNQSFNLSISGNCTDNAETLPEEPVLDEGMIPVTIANNGTVTTIAANDETWYNYDNKEWANVVLVNESSRSTYKGTTGKTVNQSDILAYYVWIPRYSYKIGKKNPSMSEDDKETLIDLLVMAAEMEGFSYTESQATTDVENGIETGIFTLSFFPDDSAPFEEFVANVNLSMGTYLIYDGGRNIDIEFQNKSDSMLFGNAVDTYRSHPAFWWDDNNNGVVETNETVAGLWVSKFMMTGDDTTPKILPNQNFLSSMVKDDFLLSLKFAGGILSNGNVTFSGSSTYGLSENVDSHMMKNSEWGAVVYLTHSNYGIGMDVKPNISIDADSRTSITGCGNKIIHTDGDLNVNCEIIYGSTNDYPQSTTGNISGIFDMSTLYGTYVMGVLSDSNGNPMSGSDFDDNSGFNGLLNNDLLNTDGIPFPSRKYYDLYLQSQFNGNTQTNISLCTLDTCGGHAFYEIAGWYPNSLYKFPTIGEPWIIRGILVIDKDYDNYWFSMFSMSSYCGNLFDISSSFKTVLINR